MRELGRAPRSVAWWVACAAGLAGCVDNGGTATLDGGAPFVLEASTPDGALPASVTLSVGANGTLDFGLVDCGGQAPASETLSITNTGAAEVHFTTTLSGTTAFQLVAPASGSVAPGATTSVTITSTALPTSETAGQVDQATLTVTTDAPDFPSATVAVERTAHGATLTLSPATAAFGDVPISASSSALPITLSNTGNAPVTLTLGAPTDPAFALSPTGTPVTVAAGASVPSLSGVFSPSATGADSATAPITTTGPICGASASAIPLTGDGTNGVVLVNPGTLDFQKVNCGAAGIAQGVVVSNGGSGSFTFTATLLGGATSPYTLTVVSDSDAGASADAGPGSTTATGTVAAGSALEVLVTPNRIPSVSSTAADAFGDTLRITTNAVGDANHDVTLTETAQGAVLSLSPSTVNFPGVVLNQSSTSPFRVTNAGNATANLTFKLTGSGELAVSPTTTTALAAGAQPLQATTTFKPTALGTQTASVAIETAPTDVVCSAPIGPVALSGTGTNGVLALSASTLDFTSVPCGQTAANKTFTLSNTGTAPFSWTAALTKGTAYTVSPASGTQSPTDPPTTITVTPLAIPFPSALTANLYGDTLTVTPAGISGGTASTVTLKETAEGAVITASPATLPAFANQQEQQASAAATLTLTNTGTMSATLTPSISGTNASSFFLATPGATALASGGHYSPGPTFKPQATGALAAQVSLAVGTSDVLCQPLPGPFALSGTGINGTPVLSTGSVTFTNQSCGATTGQTQTVKLSNNGSGTFTFNASVLGTSGFQVSPTSGSVAAGSFANLTVTSPTFTSAVGSTSPITDTLQVTTSAYGDTAHDVALSSTPQGAVLAWGAGLTSFPFGTVQATPGGSVSKSLPLSVTNSGNVGATVTFSTAGGTSEFTFSPQNTSVTSATPLSGDATFTPTVSGSPSDTAEISVAAGTPLCAALPAGLPITGTGAQGVYTTGAVPAPALTCNVAASTTTFTLNDPAIEPYEYSAGISGTGWSITANASGTVAGGGTASITIQPPEITSPATPGTTSSSATLTISTDLPGDTVHSYTVTGTASGGAFSVINPATGGAVSTYFLGTTDNGSLGYNNVLTLVNTGDAAPFTVTAVSSDPTLATLTVTLNGGGTSVAASSSIGLDMDFETSQIGSYTFTVYIPNSANGAGVCSAQTSFVITASYVAG